MTTSTVTNQSSVAGNLVSCMFGILFLVIGIINTFWGNDMGFGIFIILLSFVYFPPANALFKRITGYSVHLIVKIVLALLIIWAAVGVGELFDKIDLMKQDLFK